MKVRDLLKPKSPEDIEKVLLEFTPVKFWRMVADKFCSITTINGALQMIGVLLPIWIAMGRKPLRLFGTYYVRSQMVITYRLRLNLPMNATFRWKKIKTKINLIEYVLERTKGLNEGCKDNYYLSLWRTSFVTDAEKIVWLCKAIGSGWFELPKVADMILLLRSYEAAAVFGAAWINKKEKSKIINQIMNRYSPRSRRKIDNALHKIHAEIGNVHGFVNYGMTSNIVPVIWNTTPPYV